MTMLSPNQIKSPNFPLAGRGAYRSVEVDTFMQRVAIAYNDLLQENAELKSKFSSLSHIIEEYNAGKNAIATALLKAETSANQTMESAKANADQILGEANAKANALITEKTAEAEIYAKEKKAEADRYYNQMQSEMQRILREAEAQSKKYAEDINAQAAHIIADANEKAAAIVGAAYSDAKTAQEKTEEIISRAKVEIETTKNAIATFKEDALASLTKLLPLVEGIPVDDFSAPELSGDGATIPQVSAEVGEAPVLTLDSLFESAGAAPAAEPVAEPAAEPVAAPVAEPIAEAVEEPAVVIPEERPQATQVQFEFPGASVAAPAPAEDAAPSLFTYQAPQPVEPKPEEKPQDFKFRLTKDFNIFDD